MDGQTQEHEDPPEAAVSGRSRQRSTIAFPYMGLQEAIEVAEAIHEKVGTSLCEDVQLASWLNVSTQSSGFRVRIATAKVFGIIESPSAGHYRLTHLGRDIVDPEKRDAAKVTAFLNVPLFEAFYDRWKGRQLPPAAAIERELVSLGVAEKQKDRARQTLERSASKAGFFESGAGRLVRPGLLDSSVADIDPPQDNDGNDRHGGGGGGGKGGGGEEYHPFITGLLKELPAPKSRWSPSERAKWLRLASSAFDVIYEGDDGEIQIVEVKKQKSDSTD